MYLLFIKVANIGFLSAKNEYSLEATNYSALSSHEYKANQSIYICEFISRQMLLCLFNHAFSSAQLGLYSV